jgi:hypothetical protein
MWKTERLDLGGEEPKERKTILGIARSYLNSWPHLYGLSQAQSFEDAEQG